jgi:hypothetical protein
MHSDDQGCLWPVARSRTWIDGDILVGPMSPTDATEPDSSISGRTERQAEDGKSTA